MQKNNPIFEDISKLASGATGMMMDMKREIEQMVGDQIRQMLARMDLVSREELDVVKAMIEKARAENESLKARIETLESKKPAKTAKAAASTKKPSK